METDFITIAGREGLRDGTTALVALVQVRRTRPSRGPCGQLPRLHPHRGLTFTLALSPDPGPDPARRQDETLTVAHVGDSRGVLCRGEGRAVGITQDHKPELEAEKKRIEVRAEIATSEIATSEIATSEITAHVSISARCTHDLGEVGS